MDNAQIVAILDAPIYQELPTLDEDVEITFRTLILDLINFIDGLRMRRYMLLIINQEIGLNDDNDAEEAMDVENQDLDELNNQGFGEQEQLWIDRFTSIVEEATEEQLFVMLNILGSLNLGPEPDEALLIAMNINNDAINNINNL